VSRLGLLLTLSLLLLGGAIVVGSAIVDLRTRSTSPEATVRRYFGALGAGDVEAAVQSLSPAARARDAAFVESISGDVYRVTGIAVRSTSILDQLRGATAGPREVTIFLDITETGTGTRWQATPRVPLVEDAGRWYLARAPLAPD
jgi:hypothetical protein